MQPFLQTHFKGKFCVENVIPYYTPLIPGKKIGRHLFWTNFIIGNIELDNDDILTVSGANDDLVKNYKGKQKKDKIARNMVNPKTGKYILECAMNIITKQNINQLDIFDI